MSAEPIEARYVHSKRNKNNHTSRSLFKVLAPYLWTMVAIFIVTAIITGLRPAFDLIDVALLYLLPVLISAVRWGLWPSLTASVLGMLCFDFFFVPPVMSFTVGDVRHLFSFGVFLVVAFVTGTLAARLRSQAEASRERERRTAALYSLSDKITAETDLSRVLQTVVKTVAQSTKRDVALFMPGPHEALPVSSAYSTTEDFSLTERERDLLQWVFELRQVAVSRNDRGDGIDRLFIPVHNRETCLAVLVLQPASRQVFSEEEHKDLEALANLTALAITRMHLAIEAEQAKWLAESEKLHRALLNSVSHDLRTPLASITGAVTELLSAGDLYNAESRTTLLGTIREGALRMNRFVANLLDMARLESGILEPNREWCDISDIVGVALKEVRDMLPEDRLYIEVPTEVQLIRVDFSLIEQVLINLLENATKYSPPESNISITVSITQGELRVEIGDSGSPIPAGDHLRIFDKFYRLHSSKHMTGTGLGLSICKGIIEAHGGKIWAEPGPLAETGNRFIFTLPIEGDQPNSVPIEREENSGP
ncbi:MAG: histidine kinase [Syntrophus sp. (in: bacteria)]|nr:histidine kinase [Syntrophus sp. (in: bacteria)]